MQFTPFFGGTGPNKKCSQIPANVPKMWQKSLAELVQDVRSYPGLKFMSYTPTSVPPKSDGPTWAAITLVQRHHADDQQAEQNDGDKAQDESHSPHPNVPGLLLEPYLLPFLVCLPGFVTLPLQLR